MKLEVGKWCRTEKGTIFKIIGGNVDMWEIDIDYSYLSKCENEDYNSYAYNKNNSLFEDLVVKSSYNIIDLVEENDYINGLRVEKNKYGKLYTSYVYYGGDIGKQCEVYTTWLKDYKIEYIETIVTHQQFENMAYKVGE
jgi:hypothetical protein